MSRLLVISGFLIQFRKTAVFIAAGAVLVWVSFFDSHSLFSRIQLMREKSQLEEENALMKAEIARLEEMLERELTDEEIERIAREQYGMSRMDETVYPISRDR